MTNAMGNWLDRVFIVPGQPGVGKTWFLSCVLVDRLLRVLQDEEDAFLFSELGVNHLSITSAERHVEC